MNTAIRNPAIINAKRGKIGVLSSKGKANIELYVTSTSVRYDIGARRDRINYLQRLPRRRGTSTPYEQTSMLRKMVLSNGMDGGKKK